MILSLVRSTRRSVDAWMDIWIDLLLSPRTFFARSVRMGGATSAQMSATEFFVVSEFVAGFVATIAAMAFFLSVNSPALRSHFADAVRGAGAVATIGSFALAARMLTLWSVAAVSFLAYRAAGSTAPLSAQFRVLQYSTSLDLLPAGFATVVIMFQDPFINSGEASWHYLVSSTHGRLFFAATFIWGVQCLRVAYYGLLSNHDLRGSASRLLFAVVFAPAFLIGNVASIWFCLRLMAHAMVKNFD